MASDLVRAFTIPKCEGRSFEITKGQIFRVIAAEGKQVGDMTLLNLQDFNEKFNVPVTCKLNDRSLKRASKLYSGPPYFNTMLTVVDDKLGIHWLHGRCTRHTYQLRFGVENHANCHDNIVGSLKPFGIPEHAIPFDTFNIFMVVNVDENGYYTFGRPLIEQGDYIDFRAEMDLLVAISACPAEDEVNDYAPKSLNVEIRQG